MYKYTIKLGYEIKSCECCPFRRIEFINEAVESMDRLSGIINISRKTSYCMLTEKLITQNESVERYDSRCPLKGNIVISPDDDKTAKL